VDRVIGLAHAEGAIEGERVVMSRAAIGARSDDGRRTSDLRVVGRSRPMPRGPVGVTTVVIVHRERMTAESLAAALAGYPGLLPVATATTTAEGERLANHADTVVLDPTLADAEAAAERLRTRGAKVVFLGDRGSRRNGALVSPREHVASLAAVLLPGGASGRVSLTRREVQIMSLIVRGLAAKQVARQLGISPKTVERHKTKIFAKLGVPNQAAAVGVALTRGLTGGGPWA
jgi:DNA-binding NarL/FixJ family response regulator